MDLATLIGFLGTLGMIAGAMISAGGLGSYIDVPSILIEFTRLITASVLDFFSSGDSFKNIFPE